MSDPRPLPELGDWIGASFQALRRRGVTILLLGLLGVLASLLAMALVFGLALLAVGLIQGWEAFQRVVDDPARIQFLLQDPGIQAGAWLVYFLALLVGVRAWCTFALACIHASRDESLGVFAALRRAKLRAPALFVLMILTKFIVQLGFLLLIIPGIALAIYLFPVPFVFAAEDSSILDSLKRSLAIVRGRWWGVLGRLLLLGIICMAIAIVPLLGWVAAPILGVIGHVLLVDDLRATAA